MFWLVLVILGALVFPASALPWVMLLILAALLNYAVFDYCAFTVLKYWLTTGEFIGHSSKSAEFKLSDRKTATLVTMLLVLFAIALARYVASIRRQPL